MTNLIIILYFTIIFTYLVESNDNFCATGYTYYNNWCYKYHQSTIISLHDARIICLEDDGDLPVIHDSKTNDFITDFIGDSVWLGLSCSGDDTCNWIDNSPCDYNNFQNGKPQVYIGNAVKLLIHKDQSNFNGLWISSASDNTNATTLCRVAAKKYDQKCPSNYQYLSVENTNCYKFSNDAKTFIDASSDCLNDGGNLVSIHSSQENLEIVNFIQGKTDRNSVWIGLQYNGLNSQWIDKSNYDFNNYKDGFPNSVFGTGVEIILIQGAEVLGYWENTQSTNYLPYVCKMTEDEVSKHTSTTTTKPPQFPTLSPSNKCPNSPMYENNGVVNSPGYPSFYGDNIDCYYYLTTNKGSYVQFKIMNFDLDITDVLDIYDGNDFNNLLISLTGINNNDAAGLTLTTKDNNFMVIRFRSGNSHTSTNSGFNGYFSTYNNGLTTTTPSSLPTTTLFIDTTNSDQCPSKEFTTNSEIIASPGYPKPYGANLLCTYLLEAPIGKKVAIQFEKIYISQNEVSIEIYDGKGMSVNMLKRITTDDSGKLVLELSTSNYLTLVFYTSGTPGIAGDFWYLYYHFI
uniref:C-type LECtin n=1 Tax=Strongyloides venezuelensis TaxID=75913 RepID=A0A0K0FKT0_STRVS